VGATPRATVEAFFARYAQGDPEAAFALFHPDVVHTANAFNPAAAHSGTFRGLDALRERVAELAADWAFEHYAPLVVVAEGNDVAARVRVVCTSADGAHRVDMVIALFFVVEDGRIVAVDELFDSGLTDRRPPAGDEEA
jgi:ketosteroid isomerase-like protein